MIMTPECSEREREHFLDLTGVWLPALCSLIEKELTIKVVSDKLANN